MKARHGHASSETPEANAPVSRREFLARAGGASAATLAARPFGAAAVAAAALSIDEASAEVKPGPLKVGLVTYLLAKDWDVATIIKNCTEAKFEAVELRTTHGHGVEVSLSDAERREIRARFDDSPVDLASLGSAYEYHSADPAVVRRNIEGSIEYARLAADVGAQGIKVRPNGLQTRQGIPVEQTLEQIGRALAEVGAATADYGIEIRVEVHGSGTKLLPNMKKIMDYADHDNVSVCWNSDNEDWRHGDGLEANFALVKDKIRFVHMRDLFLEDYPFRRMLGLLADSGYDGYCCAEIPASADPVRVMKYYRALFLAYQDRL